VGRSVPLAVEIDVEGEHPLDVQVKDSEGRMTPLDPIWPGHHIRFTTSRLRDIGPPRAFENVYS